MIEVRYATLNDIEDVTEIHCSDITKWIMYSKNGVESDYEHLTIEDRFAHGGPWMSVETCAIHLNNILTNGQHPIIALYNGKPIGELELYIGDERGILDKNAYVDILIVHKKYRGKGVGRKLIEYATEIGRRFNCKTISVWPDKEAINFYRKQGFNKIAYDIAYIGIDLSKVKSIQTIDSSIIETFPNDYDIVKDMEFITPRINSSFSAWLKSRWDYALNVEMIKIGGYLRDLKAVYLLKNIWGRSDIATLYLWIRNKKHINEVLTHIFRVAMLNRIREIRLLIDKRILHRYLKHFPYRIISEEKHLAKVLGY